jgi:hypothetical protein
VRDDIDRDRFQEQLGKAAVRCSWHVYAFAIMSNHLHVVLKINAVRLAGRSQSNCGLFGSLDHGLLVLQLGFQFLD